MAQHAYDLSMYEQKAPAVVALKENKKAKRAQTRQGRIQSAVNAVVTGVAILSLLVVFLLMINSGVRMTQINNEINAIDEQLSILQSENVRLKGEIAAIASPESVEAFAQANGMSKVESHQVRYFSVDDTDSAEIPANANDNFLVSLWEAVASIFE